MQKYEVQHYNGFDYVTDYQGMSFWRALYKFLILAADQRESVSFTKHF